MFLDDACDILLGQESSMYPLRDILSGCFENPECVVIWDYVSSPHKEFVSV